ncbi:DUF4349 domain-containing protein [Mumia zhuanghuii]|uniref:DUF4349 domain-containing protein n=2 Tax=Mumia TaxID=1546255 RepID=A0ABW1QGD8_9ACTN|nr:MULTISPECIES: DUF4349 domain-containing protein [Mumia]KAA1422822.1 DUF4349 domain-containing protein [Mumia zhuanghuii]
MNVQPEIPELTDEQIDRMYRTITTTITRDDSVRRGKRRKVALVAASAVAVLGLGGYFVTAVEPSGSDSAGDSSAVQESAPDDAGADADGGAGAGTSDLREEVAPEDTPAPESGPREIITTTYGSVEVDDAPTSADALSGWVVSAGGRVENRSEYSSGDSTRVSLRLRVPASRASDATARLRDLGTLSDLSIESTDVTAQGRDLDARIAALQASVARLQQFVADAPTTAALLAAEETLAQRQGELESLQAERRGLSDQVAMATYELELSEPQKADEPDASGFLGGLTSGWNGLVATFDGAVTVVGVLLPWAVVLALLGGAYVVGRRVVRR